MASLLPILATRWHHSHRSRLVLGLDTKIKSLAVVEAKLEHVQWRQLFWGGTKKLISLYKLLTYLHTLKDCKKTNEDRNVIPKAAKSWVKNSESTGVYRVLALKLLLKKPTRTFERSEIVKFGAPPKNFFQNFRKIFPKFLVLLELCFYLRSFSRNLSEYGGIFKNFLLSKKALCWNSKIPRIHFLAI